MADSMLYAPIHVAKSIGPELWVVDGPLVTMTALPGLRAPFSTRMTVARLSHGGLWCHSPVAPQEQMFAALDALGPVQHLIAPNKLHYAHITA